MFRPELLNGEGLRPLTGIHSSYFITNYGRIYRRECYDKTMYFQVDDKPIMGKASITLFCPSNAKPEVHTLQALMHEFWPECITEVTQRFNNLKKLA